MNRIIMYKFVQYPTINDIMGRFEYTDDELEMLRVLKMQEKELDKLSARTDTTDDSIQTLKQDIQKEAARRGIDISSALNQSRNLEGVKVSAKDIPSWDELVRKADEEIDYQPVIEDFLTQNEIDFTLEEIQSINDEFKKRTKLNKTDIAFLIIATALQTLRWVIINKICGDLGKPIDKSTRKEHNDRKIEDKAHERQQKFMDKHWDPEHKDRPSECGYRSWAEILWETVPYDANKGSRDFNENMEGKYHRYRTLGHDPILGWIFGTANIITDTITLSNWRSYNIARTTPAGGKKLHFSEPTTLINIFRDSYLSIKEDKLRLPAAVFKQFVHLESDAFTKQGLPVPIIEAFSEDLAGKLYKKEYDSLCLLRDIKTVGYQAVVSVVINMLITLIHGLFYNKDKDGERNIYEVRTRKVLLYSNSLASVGNIAYSAATQDWGKLDVGGIIVTITRLFSDIKFITKVKKEFIEKEMDQRLFSEISKIDNYFN